jgi:hypothetical protein
LSENKIDVIYILSEKSSGSSFLFRSLRDGLGVTKYPKTHHFESETLYWTKAASILDRPQISMLASAVPYEKERAKRELKHFLDTNLSSALVYSSDEEMIFNGWYALIKEFGPVFIEKSPHHLLQWSALELMLDFEQRFTHLVKCHYIGIVRNPKDVILSQFRRWNLAPEKIENQWVMTYMNWQRFSSLPHFKGHVELIKYEDLASAPKHVVESLCNSLNLPCKFNGVESSKKSKASKHRSLFGYQFSQSVLSLTNSQGYAQESVQGKISFKWKCYRLYISSIYSPLKFIYLKIKKAIS